MSERAGLGSEYLELLKRALTGSVHSRSYEYVRRPARLVGPEAAQQLDGEGVTLARRRDGEARDQLTGEGRGWPLVAETMVGAARLDNLQVCVERALADDVPGDVIEAGVWRGGAAMLMRAVLKVHGDADRNVWVADSFEGLPEPDPERFPADAGDRHHRATYLAVSLEEVRDGFRRYGLLDERVRFLPGWFRDTLPGLAAERFSVVRLDGDMYESTIDGLRNLYPRLSPGGFLIVDDYGAIPACAQAVDDYREEHGITEPLERIDWTGVYWRRSS